MGPTPPAQERFAGQGTAAAAPQRRVRCSCGQVFRGDEDEDLYRVIRAHIDPLHPEQHRLSSEPPQQPGQTLRVDRRTNPAATRGMVVVVEDEPAVAELLQELLEGAGFAVVGVDCPELVHLLDTSLDPALLVVDVMLPGMSGVELAAQLQQSPYREIPMLAISASPLMLELAKSSHLFVDTVAKPFDVQTFLDAVDRSARHRGHLGARGRERVGAVD